jgi:hypothetical protein
MSISQVMPENAVGNLRTKAAAKVAVAVARSLRNKPPKKIQRALRLLSKGARPARYAEAARAREVVVGTSLLCTGPEGCLPRSIATVVLCRLQGTFPTWCAGVRVTPPFGAHAWIAAEGRDVDEPYPPGYHRVLLKVEPR